MKQGHYTVTRAEKRHRYGAGKYHLGLTAGGQRTLCRAERNVFVTLQVQDGTPRPVEYFLEYFGSAVCKRCLAVARRERA